MPFIQSFREASKALLAQSAQLEIVQHPGDRGGEREELVEGFLSPLLPERFAIGHGEIRASNGSWSKQEDLIIYDKLNSPRLFAGRRSQILAVENVAAVIEVKTSLRTKEIQESTKNIRSVRCLEKAGMATQVSPGEISFGKPSPIFGALFAFDLGVSLETFRARWVEAQSPLPPNERINLVCIPGKMVVIHVDKAFHLWDSINQEMLGNFIPMDSGEDSLLTFLLLLLRVLVEFRSGIPDLFRHFFSGGEGLEVPLVFKE